MKGPVGSAGLFALRWGDKGRNPRGMSVRDANLTVNCDTMKHADRASQRPSTTNWVLNGVYGSVRRANFLIFQRRAYVDLI